MIKKTKDKIIKMLTNEAVIDLNKFSHNNSGRTSNLKNFQRKYNYSIVPLTFYDPVPDLRDIDLYDHSNSKVLLDLKIEYGLSFIEKNVDLILNVNIIPDWLQENLMFPVIDMAAYGSMIEKYKPSKIIEIGAGYSTCFASIFMKFLKLDSELVAFEPYPQKHLLNLEKEKKVRLVQKKIQDIADDELKEISELRENDILFIDTSHVSVMGSDVNYLYIKLLPMVKKGVVIQIHDIYLPYDYSKSVYYYRGSFYNEQYLLASILANSDKFKCLFSSNDVCMKNPSKFPKKPDSFDRADKMRGGGSFWMQKN